MQFNNEKTRNVAEIAAKIMYGEQPVSEELKGGQKKLDKNKNGKLDADDFKKLRKEDAKTEEPILEYESKTSFKLSTLTFSLFLILGL